MSFKFKMKLITCFIFYFKKGKKQIILGADVYYSNSTIK